MNRKYEVAISGMAGYFPESDSVEELQKNLFDKINLVTVDDRKWAPGECGVPSPLGKLKETRHFDIAFFGIHRKLCDDMDSLTKLSMERAYEAIIDAGINPSELNGTNTAVVMASCISESELAGIFDTNGTSGFRILGHNRSMQANRVSYFLNLTGPSFSMDSSWTGGIQGLKIACDLIADGHCNAAIVGVSNIIMYPDLSIQYLSMGKLSYDGITRSFSADANGYARSEACVAFFLQRAEHVQRSYGTIMNVGSMVVGDKDVSLLGNTTEHLQSFLEETYKEAGVDPSSVAFLEADGCGIKSFDAMELNAAARVMCKNRKDPLLVGSIKSNLGHTEASSCLVSIVKGIIALDQDLIPPNLNYSSPNTAIPELISGKMKVVTEATPLPGNIIGITSLGIAGGIAHVILKQNPKKRTVISKEDTIENCLPRLFIASARNEDGIVKVLNKVTSLPLNEEFLSLTYHVWSKDIIGHLHRGYAILPRRDTPEVEFMSVSGGKQRPVWFVFSGMGSQWNGMGVKLLQLPIFKASVQKCQDVLKPKGIDVFEIITSDDPKIFDNILNAFIGIAAIQIGLVDLLFALGIKPDGIVGHSVGELGCAYADGCFTAEQTILSAYARGRASLETPLIKGMMAAIGLGYNQMKEENLPESIDVACHNAADSCTLSGPSEVMEKYVAQLKERKIFAKLVNVANIAYHSRYIASAAPILLKYLKDVITDPKPRSQRWISSSVPETEWDTDLAKYSSCEYFANNLLSPVLFEEASKYIPSNAITIEIAPHGLLQAILRRSLQQSCTNIPLTNRSHKDGLRFLLSAVGKMYMNGLLPDVSNIYPTVEFPVSRGTAPLHTLVHWDHAEKWNSGYFHVVTDFIFGERVIENNFSERSELIYLERTLSNHCVMPTAALLVFAWESLIFFKKETHFQEPIVFENVRINNLIEKTLKSLPKLSIFLQRGSGQWELNNGEEVVASGIVRNADCSNYEEIPENNISNCDTNESGTRFKQSDIYNIFEDCDLVHKENFRTIRWLHINDKGFYGTVEFKNDWVHFLDGILKMHCFQKVERTNKLHFPTFIRRIIIDPTKFTTGSDVEIVHNKTTSITAAPGFKMFDVKVENVLSLPLAKNNNGLLLEEYKFLPHKHFDVQNVDYLLSCAAQLLLENFVQNLKGVKNISVLELESSNGEQSTVSSVVESLLKKYSDVETMHISASDDSYLKLSWVPSNLLIVSDCNHISQAYEILNDKNGFLLTYSMDEIKVSPNPPSSITTIFQQSINDKKFTIFKKIVDVVNRAWAVVHTSDPNWSVELHKLRSEAKSLNSFVYLIICGESLSGIHGFVNAVDSNPGCHMIRYIFLLDKDCPSFSLVSSFYAEQLALDLRINVYKNGSWGSYHKIPLKEGIANNSEKKKVTQLHRLKSRDVNFQYLGLNLKSLAINEDGSIPKSEIGPLEYSGVNTETGEEVMGLAPVGAGMMNLDADLVLSWVKPFEWTLDDAVTVPFAYTLAYYALFELGQLRKKEKILIHCGFTPVGLAATSIALKQECEIFNTYFTPEQAQIIKSRFPDISDDHLLILDNNFDIRFMSQTKGAGVDIIVNCFSGNTKFMHNSLECLSFNGRFLHLGQNVKDITSSFGMFVFLKATSFYGINPDNLFKFSDDKKARLKMCVQEGIKDGTVRPFDKIIISGSCTDEDTYELISSNSLTDPEKKVVHCVKTEKSMIVKQFKSRKFLCHPEKTYVIIGGKSALWTDVVSWLCERGGRNFIIGIDNESLTTMVARRFTVLITQYPTCRMQMVTKSLIKSVKEADVFLSKANSLGPIGGIFFINVRDASKISFYDTAIKKLPHTVTMFISLLSNGSTVCENRRSDGLAGIAVDWIKGNLHSSKIISALDEILSKNEQNHFILSEQSLCGTAEISKLSIKISDYIPESLKELTSFGQDVGSAYFVEVKTLSPSYKEIRDVSPVFIIPGFKPNQLNKLISQLVYPSFQAKLPVDITSIDSAATNLIQEIKSFPKLEAFTLIGVGWGGMIALKIASILEAENKFMTVILLEAEPNYVQQWASILKEDLDVQLLTKYFNLGYQEESELFQKNEWSDWLEVIRKLETSNNFITDIEIGLTALRNRLVAIHNFTLNTVNELKRTPVYSYKSLNYVEKIGELETVNQMSKEIVCKEHSFQAMVDSKVTAQSVNKNLNFYYEDVQPSNELLKPIKDLIKNQKKVIAIKF